MQWEQGWDLASVCDFLRPDRRLVCCASSSGGQRHGMWRSVCPWWLAPTPHKCDDSKLSAWVISPVALATQRRRVLGGRGGNQSERQDNNRFFFFASRRRKVHGTQRWKQRLAKHLAPFNVRDSKVTGRGASTSCCHCPKRRGEQVLQRARARPENPRVGKGSTKAASHW